DPAPAGGITVTLSQSGSPVTLPATATIAAGQTTSAAFTIGTVIVAADTTSTLKGTLNGTTVSTTLTIKAQPITLTALSVAPASVPGGTGATGTVTISSVAPAGGTTITLSSDKTADGVTVPATVIVPAGSTTATFPIATLPASADILATISASLGANAPL